MSWQNVLEILEQSKKLHDAERVELRAMLREVYAADEPDEGRIEVLHRWAAKLADYSELLQGQVEALRSELGHG